MRARSYRLVSATVALLTAGACHTTEPGGDGPGPDGPPVTAAPPTFKRDVEPLLQRRCQGCHREGGVAPFSLVTYDEAKAAAPAARVKIEDRTMPPWGAFDSEACKMEHAFKDDLRLSEAEIALFGRWVDAGTPLGDASIVNPAPELPTASMPTKTHAITMPKAHEVQGGGPDDIRCFPVDPGFATDTWVNGVNVLPGNPKVVHHVLVFVDPKGESVAKAGEAGSYPCFGSAQIAETSLLIAWAPGARPMRFDDAALKVPAGSKLVLQVHYHPTATTEADRTTFEMEVRPEKPSYVAQLQLLGNAQNPNGAIQRLLPGPNDPPEGPAFLIPANVAAHTEAMEVTIPETVGGGFPMPTLEVALVGAHMHWAGVDMRIEVERRAGASGPAKECLLGTPKYDFNWQRGYAYDAPLGALPTLGPGDKVRLTCTYDNTLDNPNVRRALAESQRREPVAIQLGESTLDEMCLGALVLVRPATALD